MTGLSTPDNVFADETFRTVTDLEEPLRAIDELMRGLGLLAEALGDDEGLAVQRIAVVARKECEAACKAYSKLLLLTHPHRDQGQEEITL